MRTLAFCWLFLIVTTQFLHGDVVVIGNKNVPVDTLKKSELIDIYSQDLKNWKNGKSIVLFDLKPKTEVKNIFYDYLGKSTSRMKSIWMKKLLLGENVPPEALENAEEMLEKVSVTSGAIGFIEKNKVNDQVKILLTIEVTAQNSSK